MFKNPQWKAAQFVLAAVVLSGCANDTMLQKSTQITALSQDQCAKMFTNGVTSTSAPVPCDRLRAVSVLHIDFEGKMQQGEIVVLDIVAERVRTIFNTLYERKFPLNKVVPMDHYRGDDRAAMADNNTSAFNARAISGGSRWSLHAYGVAIDINPRQNPYIAFNDAGVATVLPPSSLKEARDRSRANIGAGRAEEVVDVFADNGFLHWGGTWKSPVDYQHFEIGSRAFTERLASATPAMAQRLFDDYIAAYRDCMRQSAALPREAARAACVARL